MPGSLHKDRILWLPFARPEGVASLAALEGALAYAMESDPYLNQHSSVKSLTRQLPLLPPGTEFDSADMRGILGELAQSHRSQWVVTGTLIPSTQPADTHGIPVESLTLLLRIYQAQRQSYSLTLSWETALFAPGAHTLETLALSDDVFASLASFCRQSLLLVVGQVAQQGVATRWQTPYALTLELSRLEEQPSRSQQLALLQQLQTTHANEPLLDFHLAKVYKALRQYSVAIEAFEAAFTGFGATVPGGFLSDILVETGICHALNQSAAQAIACWQRAILIAPDQVGPYINIAHSLEELDRLPEAETYLLQAQQLATRDERLYYNLARIYSRNSQWRQALGQYQLQLILEPEDPWCYSNIAVCYLHLSQEPSARRFLEESVRLDPEGEAGQYARIILMGMDTDATLTAMAS